MVFSLHWKLYDHYRYRYLSFFCFVSHTFFELITQVVFVIDHIYMAKPHTHTYTHIKDISSQRSNGMCIIIIIILKLHILPIRFVFFFCY